MCKYCLLRGEYVSDSPRSLEYLSNAVDKAILVAFISRVCLGAPIKSKVDDQAVRALIKLNADLGRMGGLLKLWLSEREQPPKEVRPLLNELLELKAELARRIEKL